MAYLPIACTENDHPPQQNPTASITNTYALSESTTCRSRRKLQNPWYSGTPAVRCSLQGSLEARSHPKGVSNIRTRERDRTLHRRGASIH
ncbi:hypothetical protein Q5691_01735 [Microcoleus sp. w1-18aA5]|uniref:hypothetical protein n=1 Tax=unclassified Microcoleus TaxID=2642155 RepID=UPI002FCF26E2